jgi:ABC-type transporter MlaC component
MLEGVMSFQTDPRLQGEAFRVGRWAAIREIIANNFASERMAEKVLGSHWAGLDEKEWCDFTGIFRVLFQDSYTRRVLNFLKARKVLDTEEDVREGG